MRLLVTPKDNTWKSVDLEANPKRHPSLYRSPGEGGDDSDLSNRSSRVRKNSARRSKN